MDDNGVPGFTADPKLQAKLDSLDDKLEPTEDKKDEGSDASKEQGKADSKEDKKDEQDSKKDESKEKDARTEEGDDEEKSDDDGYTIDEDEEGADDEQEPADKTKQTDTRSNLTPEQQYIIDNIQPIEVRGIVNGKEQVFKVIAPEQLPSGFKFSDDVEMAKATKAFNLLEQRATELQQTYRNQEVEKQTKEFKQREDAADRQDIAALQRNGDIPKFKADPNSKEFENDPGVKMAQAILDYKDKKNEEYLDAYNAGRPFKHIGFEEAFYMYQRENPVKRNAAQDKEDADRKDMARRTSNTKGTPAQESKKATVHSGMNSMDLDRLIEQKTQGW